MREADAARVGGIGIDDIKALQQDVHKASVVVLRGMFVERIETSGVAWRVGEDAKRTYAATCAWDGRYSPVPRGALAHEPIREAVVLILYAARPGERAKDAFAGGGRIERMNIADIKGAGAAELDAAPETASKSAGAVVARCPDRDAMPRHGIDRPLSLPLVGGRFRLIDVPVGSANDTLMKAAHHTGTERYVVDHGSNARHIAGMSDPDRDCFVLFGGQDEHPGSTTFLDQTECWPEGGLYPDATQDRHHARTVCLPCRTMETVGRALTAQAKARDESDGATGRADENAVVAVLKGRRIAKPIRGLATAADTASTAAVSAGP